MLVYLVDDSPLLEEIEIVCSLAETDTVTAATTEMTFLTDNVAEVDTDDDCSVASVECIFNTSFLEQDEPKV